jgi:hypothetical protein
MKKCSLLLLIFCSHLIYAQRQVSNLHYTWIEHFQSPKKTDASEKYQFNFHWNPETQVFAADKKNVKGKAYPRHIVDLKKRTIVVQMEKRNEYVLEEYDSFFLPPKLKLEPIEETKEINGLKCHGYTLNNDVKLTGGLMANAIKEEYSLWVTDELQFNEELNPVILALLRTQSAQGAKFKGVLVRLDYKMSYGDKTWDNIIDLDVNKLDQKPEEPVTWPWEMKDGVAWLEMPQLLHGTTIILYPGWKTDGGQGGVYRKGDGSVQIMNTRLKLLLKEITGQEKPKTRIEYFQNIFGVGAWGN